MTQFDADAPDARRKLFVEAIRAHRERGSPFLTVEADAAGDRTPPSAGDSEESADAAGDLELGGEDPPFDVERAGGPDEGPGSDPGSGPPEGASVEELPPWVQFGDGVVNLDCTEAELDLLKDLLGEYPAFRIDGITRPEAAEGANVRVSARADANRIAGFLDEVFLTVYGRPEEYRAWVVEV